MNATDLWVLAWSQALNQLSAQPLAEHCGNNRAAYRDDEPGDWRILATGSQNDMLAARTASLGTLASRQAERGNVVHVAFGSNGRAA